MSIDMALLDRAERQGESWFRLYRWDPCCLSFGRHEPASRSYDVDRIRRLGVDTVRRPTGGRAVWHDCEITYAVASPCSRFGSLRAAYLEIHRLLLHALKSLGLAASLAPRQRPAALDAGACFAQPVGGEVLINGRKVIGSAQVRRGSALLQHGSILLRDDQGRVTDLLQGRSGPAPLSAGSQPTLWTLRPKDMADAIVHSAQTHWAAVPIAASDGLLVLEESAQHHPRFRSESWTWAR
jgi:lipoate-protein ligase A